VLAGAIEADKDIQDVRWAAYMLATVLRECGIGFKPIRELARRGDANFLAYEGRADLGNTAKGDGLRFCGRGLVQITGRRNYHLMSSVVGVDLIAAPDRALEFDISYKIMSHGMRFGSFTGRKLSDYIHGQMCDYQNSRRIINGLDRAAEVAANAVRFEALLKEVTR
jgi:predicted chitinase